MEAWFANRGVGAGRGRIFRFSRDERGVTAIEFAFVAPILFAVLLATLQIAVIFFAESYLATVADATMRTVLTNQAATSGVTIATFPAQFRTELCKNVTALLNCNQIIISLQPAPTTSAGIASALPTFDATGKLVGTPAITCINPNQQALLILMYQWPVISGPFGYGALKTYFGTLANGTYPIAATEVFQTEPSANSNACPTS
jgi:Flp pilus assembly protein TadG